MTTAFMAATSTSMAATTLLLPQLPTHCSALPKLPPPFSTSTSFKQLSVIPSSTRSRRSANVQKKYQFQIKVSSSEESAIDAGEIFTDIKEKWDAVENKSTVIVYGGGALVAVWLSSVLIGAINSVPLLPKVLEFVGVGYTGWFVYRYLLFKSSRKELATDVESLKKKIAGTE